MLQQIQFAGSWYSGMSAAAGAWAETALPDTDAIGADEDPAVTAEKLEAFWWQEAQRIGGGGPEGVNEEEWRRSCRTALQQRIELAAREVTK